MSSPSQFASQNDFLDDPPPVLRWQSWPLFDHKFKSLTLLLVTAILTFLVWKIVGSLLLALIVLVILLLTLWRLYLPIVFEWNDDGITETALGISRFIAWSDIKDHRISDRGVLFLPNRIPFPLDLMRGLYVPWPANKEQAVLMLDYYRQSNLFTEEVEEDEETPSPPPK